MDNDEVPDDEMSRWARWRLLSCARMAKCGGDEFRGSRRVRREASYLFEGKSAASMLDLDLDDDADADADVGSNNVLLSWCWVMCLQTSRAPRTCCSSTAKRGANTRRDQLSSKRHTPLHTVHPSTTSAFEVE